MTSDAHSEASGPSRQAGAALTFEDLLAPFTPQRFFDEHLDRKPLVVRGTPEKFAHVFPWPVIERLMALPDYWTDDNMVLYMDGKRVPPPDYCRLTFGRGGESRPSPDLYRVREWIRRSASVVLNRITRLTPELEAVNAALESTGLGTAWANAYISWPGHPALPVHADTSEIWVVQVHGSKTWNLWSGRAEWPLTDRAYRAAMPDGETAKGPLLQQVRLNPGDLLYMPHGQYHDALAEAETSVHITYGISRPTSLDLLRFFADRAVHETLFRKPLPPADGSPRSQAELRATIEEVGQRIGTMWRDPELVMAFGQMLADRRPRKPPADLLRPGPPKQQG